MNFDHILRTFWERPVYQRLFLAFTVGLFLSCGARMAEGRVQPTPTRTTLGAPSLHPVVPSE